MLLYFTIILNFLEIKSSESQLLQLGQLVGGFITPDLNTNQQYFTFIVPAIIENENLILMLQSNVPTGTMRVTVSRIHLKPIDIDQGDIIVCTPYQEQLCILNNQIVKSWETLYMSVICFSPSNYKFKIVSEKEILGELKLYENDFLKFQINEGESKKISFYEQTKETWFHFCVFIQCCDNDVYSLTLTSNFDDEFDEGIDLYKINEFDKAFCWNHLVEPDQVFTLSSKKKFILEAKSSEFKYINDIDFFGFVQVTTTEQYQQVYKLDVYKEVNCNYGIFFITPEVHQTLYINPNSLPQRYEDFRLVQTPEQKVLYLNFFELQKAGLEEVESFYIVAKSDVFMTSIFTVACCSPTDERCGNYLESDFTYKSKIKQQQDLEFTILTQIVMQVHFDLHIKSIKGFLQIILYDCSTLNDRYYCNLESEIAAQLEKQYFSIREGETFKQEIICKFQLKCNWKIVVRLDETETDGFFEIDYTAVDRFFIIHPQLSFLEIIRGPNLMEKLKFQMTDFSNIERIQFQITFFFSSGEIYLYKFYKNREDEMKSKNNILILDSSNTNFQELKGINLLIKTKKVQMFALTSWVIRKATPKKQLGYDLNDYVKVGFFDKVEIDLDGDLPLFLKIEMPIFDEFSAKKSGIYIHKFFGSIDIIGYTHLDHNGPVLKWKSKDFLIFNLKQLSGQTIMLRVKNSNGYQKSCLRIQSGFHFQNKYNSISLNIPQFHTFDDFTQAIFISLLQIADQIQLTSNQLLTEYNQMQMDFQTNLAKLNELRQAAIQSGVYTELFESIQFKLMTHAEHFTMILLSKFDQNVIDLIQGFWIKKIMPLTKDYLNIHSNGQEIYLGIIANTKNLEIFIRFAKQKDEEFPDSKNYELYFEHQQSDKPQFYFISSQQLTDFGCIESCVVKITLHRKNIEINKQIMELRILYQSRLSVLYQMIQQLGCAQKNNIQYYTFDSSQNLKQLSILIQSNECELKYNIFKDVILQQESSQMRLISKFSQIIRVEETDKIFENQKGDLYLAIQGEEGCHYSINFDVGTNYQAFKIFPNTLYQLQLENEDKIFLLIDNINLNQFLISIESQTNLARFYIANLNFIKNEIKDLVNNKTFEQFLNHNQNQGYRNYFKGQKIFIVNVLLVAIESLSRDTIFIKILNSEQHLPTLQKDYQYSYSIVELKQEDFLITERSNKIYFFFKVLEGEIDLFYLNSQGEEKLSDDEDMNDLEFTDFNNMKLAIINKEIDENIYIRIKFYYDSSIEFYYSTDQIRLISPTYLEQVILKPMSEEVLIFKNPQLSNPQVQDEELFFSLQVFVNGVTEDELIDKIEKPANLQVEVKSMNNEIQQPILFIRNSDSYYFEFEREAKDYQIIIRNFDEYQQQYSIMINIAKSQRLIKKIKHISTIEEQETNFFSISQIDKGREFLFYDIQICSGQFSISANHNLTNLKAKHGNTIIDQNNEQHLLGFIEFNSPYQYLQFQLKELNKQQELNYFTYRVYEVQSNLDIPINQVQIIDDGNFELTILQNQDETMTLQITFNTIEYYQELNPNNVLKYIEYYILLLDEPDEQQNFNYCVPPKQKIKRIYKENDETILTEIQVPNQYQYYVNIQATMNFLIREELEIHLDFFYEPQHLLIEEFKGEDSSQNLNPNYLQYGAILGSSALIYQFQKIYKRKRNQQQNQSNDMNQQLNNEVQEIELNQSNI